MSKLTILNGQLTSRTEPRTVLEVAPVRFEGDAEYFERRANEELAYAVSLADPQCRALHTDLASRHAQLAAALREATARTD